MRNNYFLFLFVLGICNMSVAQNFNWAGSFGGGGEDVIRGMHVDAAGNVYTTGYFTDTADFDIGSGTSNLTSAGWYDIFIQKTNSNGELVWAKRFGGAGFDLGTAISTDGEGNVFVSGVFEESTNFSDTSEGAVTSSGGQDVFILKLDAAGNFNWVRSVGSLGYEETTALDTTPSGDVVLAGHFSETIDFDPGSGTALLSSTGGNDTFLFKLMASGDLAWAKTYGGSEIDIAMDLEVGTTGDIYLTGYFEGTADMNPTAGETMNLMADAGGFAAYVSHLDSSGQLIYAGITHGGSVQNNNITVDSMGNMYVTGYFSGTANFNHSTSSSTATEFTAGEFYSAFVAQYKANGSIGWARQFVGTDTIFGFGIGIDSAGNVFTSGYFGGTADFDPSAGESLLTKTVASATEAFLCVLDNSGAFVNAFQYGGVDFIDTHTLGTDAFNNVYMAGQFESVVDLNPMPGAVASATSSSFRDNYIIKMNALSLEVHDNAEVNLVVYPMPVRDQLYIQSITALNGVPYFIYDNQGRKVAAGQISPANSIVTDALAAGMYYLKINGHQGIKMLKE